MTWRFRVVRCGAVWCAASCAAFTGMRSVMPPSGQHDIGESVWCITCYANPLKHHVIVTGGNYLTDCAAFTRICNEQRGACTVPCSEMPPAGQHDNGVSGWCIASCAV
jgi:hypothetical protein